jgi:hypothetical protein
MKATIEYSMQRIFTMFLIREPLHTHRLNQGSQTQILPRTGLAIKNVPRTAHWIKPGISLKEKLLCGPQFLEEGSQGPHLS